MTAQEVQVLLNGQIRCVCAGQPQTINGEKRLSCCFPPTFTDEGAENTLTFTNRSGSETWGVRNIAVAESFINFHRKVHSVITVVPILKKSQLSVSFIFDGKPGDVDQYPLQHTTWILRR